MEVTIDKFGRILIPKRIRKILNLSPEQNLELILDEYSGSLILSPSSAKQQTDIVFTEFGFPVVQNGEPDNTQFDTVAFLKATREEYLDRKMGIK